MLVLLGRVQPGWGPRETSLHLEADVPWEAPSEPVEGPACPGCLRPFRTLEVGSVQLAECPYCAGHWFGFDQLEGLSQLQNVPRRLLNSYAISDRSVVRKEGERCCPHCAKALILLQLGRTTVEACTDCRGAWLEKGELKSILEARAS